MARPDLAICTIATRSHFALSRTLLESAAASTPAAERYLLLVDGAHGSFPPVGVRVLHATDLVEPTRLADLVARYTAAEVCFALKPVLLTHLLDAGHRQVHYADSDIWLLGPLDGPVAALHGNAVLVTPHLIDARPLDGSRPSDLELFRAGTFNAGYLAVAEDPRARAFLAWWGERAWRWGYNDPRLGMCGDQRWLDPAPYLFGGVVVCRDPGINAGFWRRPFGPIGRGSAGYTINGAPLVLLHLSGFDPNQPGRMSRYPNSVDVASDPVLSALLREYAARLLEHGWARDREHRWPHRRWWHGSSLPVRILRGLHLHRLELRQRRTGS